MEDIFQQIGNLSDDVYFIFDINRNRFEYISPAFENIWGTPVKKIFTDPGLLLKTVHTEDRGYINDSYSRLELKHKSKFEFRIKRKNKAVKYIELSVYPMLEDNRTRLLTGIARDITNARNNIYYAEKINARKNSTLTILAHDLKGPIGIVNMIASSLRHQLKTDGNDNTLQSIQNIQDLCQRNIDLINDLLKQEFLESPEVDLRKERVDLVWAINDVIESYKKFENVLSKKFKLTSSSSKLYVQIDNLKLMQVINNLISNAIKFTSEDGEIKVDIKDRRRFIRITVSDNGIGIPKAVQPYLFDKFTRARRTGLQGEETTGLGMAIIKALVELHKGTIWFESEENKGSSFFIDIPK